MNRYNRTDNHISIITKVGFRWMRNVRCAAKCRRSNVIDMPRRRVYTVIREAGRLNALADMIDADATVLGNAIRVAASTVEHAALHELHSEVSYWMGYQEGCWARLAEVKQS